MHHLDFVLIAALAFFFGLVSKRIQKTPLTLPICALLIGLAVGPLGLDVSHLDLEHLEGGNEVVRLLAEFTLALVLFYDASRIDLSRLRTHLRLPVRLLGPGLLGTVALGFALGVPLLGDTLGLWEIALLAALLAPTDAALGQAVVTQASVPLDERTALNVESGLNDGLVVPLVAALMACSVGSGQGGGEWYTWLLHALKAIGYGVVPGIALGYVAARMLDAAQMRGWMEAGTSQVAVAAVPVMGFFGAEMIGGSGFLAAFVAGLTVGAVRRRLPEEAFAFTESATEMLGLATWTIFGVTAAPVALECFTAEAVIYALLSLTVIRVLPVALALVGTGQSLASRLFLGWFGPRGLASVVFAVSVLDEPEIQGRVELFGIAVWTVLLSIVLHGMTAGWLARRYGEAALRGS